MWLNSPEPAGMEGVCINSFETLEECSLFTELAIDLLCRPRWKPAL
jgi:hypothetical protein